MQSRPIRRARSFISVDEARARVPAARWASAIAASLPDGSSSPLSIVSTPDPLARAGAGRRPSPGSAAPRA